METSKSKTLKIIFAIAGIIIVAVLGSVFVAMGMDWFNLLIKPSQWIPNIVIPIVWTIIYVIFGIVLTRWIVVGNIPKSVFVLLIVNGVLNILWCLVFFTLELTFIGNIVIILNLIAGFALYYAMFKNRPVYAYLISIYPIWLSIATSLNLALWILN